MSNIRTLQPIEYFNYFKSKKLPDLDIDELSFIHLDTFPKIRNLQDVGVSSCLHSLVETLSASFINVRTNQYVPLMTSFAILDQIGKLYSVSNNPPSAQNGIKRALYSFSNFPADLIDDLVTLRHGLFHDGSLTSRNSNMGTNVIFRMVRDSGKVVTPPKHTWDGEYRDQLQDHVTNIDLKEFQKLTINILENCMKKWNSNELICGITDPKEFYYKFLFSV